MVTIQNQLMMSEDEIEDEKSDHDDSNIEDIYSDETMKGYNDTNDDDSIDEEEGDSYNNDDYDCNDSNVNTDSEEMDEIYDRS